MPTFIIMANKERTYPQDPYRFVILAAYLVAALVNSIAVHTFSSINVIIEDTFQISGIEVTLNALLFTIAHPVFALPCNWLINKYGMRVGFIVGAVLLVGGVWLRLLLAVGQSFYCLLGSMLAAIGNIFILNTPSKVALNWFSKERVGIVTFSGILVGLLSITIGASVPSFLIDKNTSVEDVKQFLMLQAIVITIPMVALALLFREKPSEAPSKAANAIFNQERTNYKSLLKQLFKNPDYLKIAMTMTLNYGTITALIMVLDQLLAGLGYNDSGRVTSVTIAASMLAGIISNPLFSFLLKRTRAYRAVSALSTFGSFLMTSLTLLGFIYHIKGTAQIIFLGAMLGFFFVPLPSILISYSSEVVFPIDESSSAGYLFACSQTFGFIVGFSSISYLTQSDVGEEREQRSQVVAFILMGLLLFSFLASLWVKERLRKWKFEQTEYRSQRISSNLKASLVVQDEAMK